MSQTLTQELLDGSRAADFLKTEIEMVLGMLVSHVNEPDWDILDDGREDDESLKFPIPNMDAYWLVTPTGGVMGDEQQYHLHITFLFEGEEGYRRRDNKSQIDRDLITQIHSTLPYLTDGMVASIPGLLKRLEYLKRTAAYVKELEASAQ